MRRIAPYFGSYARRIRQCILVDMCWWMQHSRRTKGQAGWCIYFLPRPLHFGISSSDHFRQILKSKNLEIVHYYCAFCFLKSTKHSLNLNANSVNLFLREPLAGEGVPFMQRPHYGMSEAFASAGFF